ncbi:MAG: dTDP-4-dehydrorhamnose 3,5-epimerase [bacterium]|nr:dTDP-4-dehydrorhamnose 3,5-epimerase [bacterium]
MEIRPTSLPGCLEILVPAFKDNRGSFVKTFNQDFFTEHGLTTNWQEEYYSFSNKDVLRGLHFQTPPFDHEKIVHCAAGRAFDVVVDLRTGSPTYGQYLTLTLDSRKANMLYIPRGMAHGFMALEEHTLMMYKVASVHAPDNDKGILWDSCGIPWPDREPIISERDLQWPTLEDYLSPFVFTPEP